MAGHISIKFGVDWTSYFGRKVVWSFNRSRQVAPTGQERSSHAWLCRAFQVEWKMLFTVNAYFAVNN